MLQPSGLRDGMISFFFHLHLSCACVSCFACVCICSASAAFLSSRMLSDARIRVVWRRLVFALAQRIPTNAFVYSPECSTEYSWYGVL